MKCARQVFPLLLGLSLMLVQPGCAPVWLSKGAIDVPNFLAPPPKPGTKADLNDLTKVREYQASRKAEDCKRARAEARGSLGDFFGPPNGPLTVVEVEKWSKFFSKIESETDYFAWKMKKAWNRPRPAVVDSSIKPCLLTWSNLGYPSGHATASRTFAEILSELKPAQRSAFEDRAARIAENRVVAGVHRPTDIEAGKTLGDEIARRLLANQDFRKELGNLQR